MTFSLATNPPGGVVQASFSDVGEDYCLLKLINAISVILLLVSGIPMDNTFTIWLLSSCMCVTLTFLALTFMFAAKMITPDT
ncbi:hypothetical protein A2U01_0002962, partial [Trifolium medium]|nr:hypothetical protein [Trifolium medium]